MTRSDARAADAALGLIFRKPHTDRSNGLSPPESAFQVQVIEFAEVWQWRVAHFHDSRRQVRPGVFVGDAAAGGFPDLVFVRERLVIAELKTERGRLRPAQHSWIQALQVAGVEVYVWRPSDWSAIEHVLGRKAA